MPTSDTPLVSVLIPAYNHERYVQETIHSIIQQTYENIELLVIDDGSSDMTWERIESLRGACEKRFARVLFATHANKGLIETLNLLLTNARGEYVYLIASDDMAKPHAIATQLSFLSQHADFALAVGDNELVDDASQRIFWDENKESVYLESEACYKTFGEQLRAQRKDVDFFSDSFGSYRSLLDGNYIPNGYLIRSSILERTGLYNKNAPLEDYYMAMQIAKYGKMKYIDDILFSYRWHDTNSVKNQEKMKTFFYRTLHYEKSIVESLDNDAIIKVFNSSLRKKRRVVFSIKGIFFIYKIKNVFYKEIRISLGGKDMALYRKSVKE